MIEQTFSKTLTLSERHPKVEIELALKAESLKLSHVSFEIHMLPSLIPVDLLDPIWSRIQAGATAAIWKIEQVLLSQILELIL